MKHITFFNRFLIVTLWSIVFGMGMVLIENLNNVVRLGWPTLLCYFWMAVMVVYGLVMYSKTWSNFK